MSHFTKTIMIKSIRLNNAVMDTQPGFKNIFSYLINLNCFRPLEFFQVI